ncbi:PDDEXK nuclease domain-containing protein [Duganella sp. S19_KUP01_CR8]|uniref:PDDEXK nuclease domain-containing protein n=1 Tax=Duganella sp. S19_KUP01_CR8 TaxID=3025502 RepID=UPI002FCD7420
MSKANLTSIPGLESLHAELRGLIESSRQRLSSSVNAELSRLYWTVGQRLHSQILVGERARYGTQIMARLGQKLANEFGRGFEVQNLRRMVQFVQAFPDLENVASLMRHLSWTHFLQLLPVRDEAARWCYAQQSVTEGGSVRELHRQIERKSYERSEIAASQLPPAPLCTEATSAVIFKDPYFLDFLGLRRGYDEADLETAILLQLEAFILALGRGFAFVERNKRMVIDGEDFHLDLLFFHRRLHRLVAIELKLGRFKASHKGQMELYLKWLDKHERHSGEESPIGLILCAESRHEQIELLQMHKDGITVAEYWTELPSKAELERKLHMALEEARERLARRGALFQPLD